MSTETNERECLTNREYQWKHRNIFFKNQTEILVLKNAITKIKTFTRRTQQQIWANRRENSEFEGRSIEMIQSEEQAKTMKKNDLWYAINCMAGWEEKKITEKNIWRNNDQKFLIFDDKT